MKDLNGMRWNRNEVNVDMFLDISNNEDHEFKSIKNYRKGKYMQMEKRQFQ